MKGKGLTRRRFLGAAGKGMAAVAACGLMCREACGAQQQGGVVYAICGIYCGACSAYMSSINAKTSSEIKCLGCTSVRKQPGYAPKCEVRKCAKLKRVDSCGLCKSYPCDKIKAFFNEQPKYGLREKYLNTARDKGLKAWLDGQKERWICSKCKTPFGYGAKSCGKCGEDIYSDTEEFEEFKKSKPQPQP